MTFVTRTNDLIDRRDAALYADVKCTTCGKLMALSNAVQYENKYLCERHAPTFSHLFHKETGQ